MSGVCDWNPRSDEVHHDQEAAYDVMRRRCPVAYSELFGWTLFRHADVMRALLDHETFSNVVSHHVSVPNGMDPPDHTVYRSVIEPYFSEARMAVFEPECRRLTRAMVQQVLEMPEMDLTSALTLPFAVSVQCAFLGWPEDLKRGLIDWILRSQRATLAQDRAELSRIAGEFRAMIRDLMETRREAEAGPDHDITASLMHDMVRGRLLNHDEVASILRNWTAGEIGTISAAAGILVWFLASHPELHAQLREKRNLLPYAIDEILRIHGPLVMSRRVTTKDVEIGGRQIAAGQRISLNWISANRDEDVFEEPEKFRFGRDPEKNLLYGAGIHVCPGAPLARLELLVFMETLFDLTTGWEMPEGKSPQLAFYPASGFSSLPMRLKA